MGFTAGFLIGSFIGSLAGIFIISLMVAAKDGDDVSGKYKDKW